MDSINEKILLIVDRDREVEYDGESMYFNTYKCSSCCKLWIGEMVNKPKFCGYCGVFFEDKIDVSV